MRERARFLFTSVKDFLISKAKIATDRQIVAAITMVSLVSLTCTCRAADLLRPTWQQLRPLRAPETGMRAATD